ncbi:hypothetical protein Tco_0457929 [Tanacetum coccineum]
MTASMVGDSNLEKILSAEIVNKMSSSSSANKKKVPSLFYSEDNSDEDEWGEDVEVEVEIKDNEDNSTVKRLSSYHDTIFLSTKAKSREDIEGEQNLLRIAIQEVGEFKYSFIQIFCNYQTYEYGIAGKPVSEADGEHVSANSVSFLRRQ